jgi:hypothetical protein
MYQSNNVTMMQKKMIGKLLHCFIGTLLNFYSKN